MTAQGSRTILVVDDDPDVRQSLADILESRHFHVLCAGHGEEALRLLESAVTRPDVILLDMLMPVMDGAAFRVAQHMRPGIADIPVVLISAYPISNSGAFAPPPDASLKKPFDIDYLVATVDRVTRTA